MPNFAIIKNLLSGKKLQKIKVRDMKNFDEKKFLNELEELKKP